MWKNQSMNVKVLPGALANSQRLKVPRYTAPEWNWYWFLGESKQINLKHPNSWMFGFALGKWLQYKYDQIGATARHGLLYIGGRVFFHLVSPESNSRAPGSSWQLTLKKQQRDASNLTNLHLIMFIQNWNPEKPEIDVFFLYFSFNLPRLLHVPWWWVDKVLTMMHCQMNHDMLYSLAVPAVQSETRP